MTVKERIRAEIDRATRRRLAQVFGVSWYRSIEGTERVADVRRVLGVPDSEGVA